MANTNTLARAIIEIGTSGVPDAEAQLRSLEADLRDVGRQYEAGRIQIDEYLGANSRLHNEINSLRDGLDTAQAALKKYGSSAAALSGLEKETTKSVKNTGMAFLELSRAFEDAQYGLRGVLNNIPSTIQMFGGPAGLAAGVSAVAVAINIALPKVQEFIKSLGSEGPKIFDKTLQGIKDKIEAIEAKPLKFDADYQVLNAAKQTLDEINKGLSAYQAIKNRATSVQEERGRILSDAVVENAGGAENLGNVIERIRKGDNTFAAGQGQALIQRERLVKEIRDESQAVKDLTAMGGDTTVHNEALQKAKAKLAELDNTIQTEGRKQIDALIGEFTGGSEKARVEIQKMLAANQGAFKAAGVQDIFGFQVGQASNEEIAARRKEQSDIENQRRMVRLGDDLKKKAEKEEKERFNAQVEQLNKQGKEGEAEALRENRKMLAEQEAARKQMERDTAKEVGHVAAAFGGKFDDSLKAAALNRFAKGQAEGVIRSQLRDQVQKALRQSGVDNQKVADEAAQRIIDKVLDGMQAGLKIEGPNVRAAAGRQFQDLRIKQARQVAQGERNRGVDDLAQDIEAGSLQATGVQFTPEQAQAAARATAGMVGRNVDFNVALQAALAEQVQAMTAIGNSLMQQAGQMQQIRMEFQQVRRGIQTRQRSAGKRG